MASVSVLARRTDLISLSFSPSLPVPAGCWSGEAGHLHQVGGQRRSSRCGQSATPSRRVRPNSVGEDALTDSFCPPLFVSLQDGRLAAGDQLLSVDGRSLVGLSQER